MDVKQYFDCKSNSKFILDFDSLNPVLHDFSKECILSIPYPTKKEIQAFTPLTHNQLMHIAVVLVTHQNVHNVFSSVVPNDIPENIFWCKYFRFLYTKCGKEKQYQKKIRARDRKRNDQLVHVLSLWKSLINNIKSEISHTVNPREGLLILSGTKECLQCHPKLVSDVIKVVFPFASSKSTMFKRTSFMLTSPVQLRIGSLNEDRVTTENRDELKSQKDRNIINIFINDVPEDHLRTSIDSKTRTSLDLMAFERKTSSSFGSHVIESLSERPRMSVTELQRNSITSSDSDIPAHRFTVSVFNILFGKLKSHKLQFVGPLLNLLVKHYSGLEAYVITHCFVCNCLYRGLYPYTIVQFDYFFIAFDELVRERFPDYVDSLTVSLVSIYENLFTNLLIPLLDSIDKFIALTILEYLLLYGYPFALKIILILIEQSSTPPKRSEEVIPTFSKVLEYDAPGVIAQTLDLPFPDYANYHFLLPIKESVHSTNTPYTSENKNLHFIQERMTNLTLPSDMIPVNSYVNFVSMLPDRFAIMDFTCLFSTKTDGFSLSNLYSLCAARSPLIILVRDDTGALFGGYVSDPIKIHRHYYGTGESFLFTIEPHTKKYSSTSANNYFIMTNLDKFIMGGGDGFPGLGFNRSLEGQTYTCPTFKNEPLTVNENFKTIRLEIWTCASVALISNFSESESASSSRQSIDGGNL
ncbi:hypothetical protein ENUP19_0252G0032 [Entamoeba nuttalli]|uniref:TLD domain containing protein n=2 Tax=Entamoeba nuttalli TaxID=412467 RepID=K2G9X3_ENTNP|nr:TLD domain containing protein [Entamoeba nuttalli P19]EKE39236.1 TLD domain containing protein [Entamoeba nuttalli P19]|eukprot:XP_008858433.1 TLD domain containing protein [Entamoeba nuttalli P19]